MVDPLYPHCLLLQQLYIPDSVVPFRRLMTSGWLGCLSIHSGGTPAGFATCACSHQRTSTQANTYATGKIQLQKLLPHLRKCSETGSSMNIGQARFRTSLNLLGNTILSLDLADTTSESAR
ncbi:hypothetical protein CDL15_Pgr017818 [Punica granatum]|uniref:Uncharacterized protein n=1 Tax=Punica granatum TaxID=22663 RepID=A0A218WGI1_PUNGR|nr:hypothetical protein CDL15_Pgr017818 [Punica granatum]